MIYIFAYTGKTPPNSHNRLFDTNMLDPKNVTIRSWTPEYNSSSCEIEAWTNHTKTIIVLLYKV